MEPHRETVDQLTEALQNVSIQLNGYTVPDNSKPQSQQEALQSNTSTASSSTKVDDLEFSLHAPEQQKQQQFRSQDEALEHIAQKIKQGSINNVICLVGAGISVSAGIPDFRTRGSGLFDKLEEYELPSPEAVFEIGYFKRYPLPFYKLMKQLLPNKYEATPTHHFMKLLHEKGILKRVFSQNIDSLEVRARLPQEKLIAAHGNFDTAHCTKCKSSYDIQQLIQRVENGDVPVYCNNKKCRGLVKPGIVFYGEPLPDKFFQHLDDFQTCDLLIVMGTSLKVQPFSLLVDNVNFDVPRLLINRDLVGPFEDNDVNFNDEILAQLLKQKQWNKYQQDMAWLGDCDAGVGKFAKYLGWEKEFKQLCQK
eukprot:TRINITY_DN1148_c0_g1_i1.p1 TRINITY_DN1148_c0_g1~~TRINITY_DN1148_c0_g1_i1.p1  ORF type:complete len:365 (-),score=46.91 TRINITY_DN1148_c0_g1_i1:2229-3323(-)